MNLFILAGEPSGDRIGADLVRKLRQRGLVKLSGVGGSELIAEGLPPLYPMSDLSVMGFADVFKRLPLLLWRIEQTARAVIAADPDIVVLIDAQEFSTRLGERLRRLGFAKPIALYVSPAVWAHGAHRAQRLKPVFDEVLAVLPFEPAVMRRLGGPPTVYVGHPSLAEPTQEPLPPTTLALLPGSRTGELTRHLAMLREVAAQLAGRFGIERIFIPTLPGLEAQLAEPFADWSIEVEVSADRARRRQVYRETLLAIAVSGTATLELALAGVPSVITYVMDRGQTKRYARIGRPRIGLPNIVLNADVAPEVVLEQPDAAKLAAATEAVLRDGAAGQRQREAFAQLRSIMENGAVGDPRKDPADRVLALVEAYAERAVSGS